MKGSTGGEAGPQATGTSRGPWPAEEAVAVVLVLAVAVVLVLVLEGAVVVPALVPWSRPRPRC